MVTTFLGKKLTMTNRYDSKGVQVPVTRIAATPNTVLAIRTLEIDGYQAVQLGFGQRKHTSKPMAGHIKKANLKHAPLKIKETRITEELLAGVEVGQQIAITDVLQPGTFIDVQGVSKGKGFQGGMKRWGFHGGPASHGQSDRMRAPGSIGSGTTPGRVYKGKKMAGHMGVDTVTVKKLTVFAIDEKNNIIEVLGSVPGYTNGLLFITAVGENKKYVAPLQVIEETPVVEETLKADVEEGAQEVYEAETEEPKDVEQVAETKDEQPTEDAAQTEPTEETDNGDK